MAIKSEAQKKAVSKYVSSHYDKITLTVSKGVRDEVKAAADAAGESLNGYAVAAIRQRMEREEKGSL